MSLMTTIHCYRYNTHNPDELIAYQKLKTRLLKSQPRLHCAIPLKKSHYFPAYDGLIIGLETFHLFENQWNSSIGRVFDWAEDYFPRERWIHQGHWLEQTEEMAEIRSKTLTCGYCGYQTKEHFDFCPSCLGSSHLDVESLNLLRMLPVDKSWSADRPPLTDNEKAYLLPLYHEAQNFASSQTIEERRSRRIVSIKNKQYVLDMEREGFNWLFDHSINTENVIFYSHLPSFSFGWRKSVTPEFEAQIKGFPYPHTIKRSNDYENISSDGVDVGRVSKIVVRK